MPTFIDVPTSEGIRTINLDTIAILEEIEGGLARLTLTINNGMNNNSGGSPRVVYSSLSYNALRAILNTQGK